MSQLGSEIGTADVSSIDLLVLAGYVVLRRMNR